MIVLYCKRRCAYWFWSWLSQRICDIIDMWIVYLMIDIICYMLHVILLLSFSSQILWRAGILKRMLTDMSTESWERGIYIRSSGSQAVSFKNSASWNGQLDGSWSCDFYYMYTYSASVRYCRQVITHKSEIDPTETSQIPINLIFPSIWWLILRLL